MAVGATGNNYDTAVDIGSNDPTARGSGAFAGNASLTGGTDTGTDSNDGAYDFGDDNSGSTYAGAFAGNLNAVDSVDGGGSGNGDTAYDIG